MKAATVCGASSSSQRATKRIPAAVISSTARTYPCRGRPGDELRRARRPSCPVALPGGIAPRLDHAPRSRRRAARICSAVSSRTPSGRRRAGVAVGAARRRRSLCARVRVGRHVGDRASSGASTIASATAPTPAAPRIHQSRRPACQRLKKCRIAATIAKIASRTSQAWSLPEGEREVAGEHREDDRQRQVVVVHRALLGAQPRRGVRLAALLLRADELPVRRDDHEEDVRRHDRPEHRADLEERPRARRRARRRRTPRASRARPPRPRRAGRRGGRGRRAS